jgi:hypothetical protein
MPQHATRSRRLEIPAADVDQFADVPRSALAMSMVLRRLKTRGLILPEMRAYLRAYIMHQAGVHDNWLSTCPCSLS